ncbi:60Kd inner membrane protein-domain-containing protein [Desarmillaria tabescens]|uniref:60Kd inner membrane protein-domain-containing protein n=1 Tax=Armillaria tabescens TaxID=1929756 RepID=A0AA39NMP0_ARMTA|nr:60Kd inner membrane protein-domain-containing protein [Desarmillaria tabescens]KAK0468233.1 60Kd inner membrane protein-domain-containing protein [Desarmillaria tabescens]
MFRTCHRGLRLASHPHHGFRAPTSRRDLSSVANSFLDFATAIPYPTSLPPYSSTIILVTVLTRIALLPIATWGNNRMLRYQQLVIPEVEKRKPYIWQEELIKMRKEGFRGDKEETRKVLSKRIQPIFKGLEKQLCKVYRCQKIPTMVVPPLSQMAVFFPMSIFFGGVATDPFSGFDAESFMTLTSLSHPDETLTVPILVGLITMANVESSTWFMTATEKQAVAQREQRRKDAASKGVHHITPANGIKQALRVVSVMRIVFAAQVSGAVALYWATSSLCGLFQTWFMESLRRRKLGPPPPNDKAV